MMVYIWLVVTGTMEFYDFPYIGNGKSSQLTIRHIFQRGRAQPFGYGVNYLVTDNI